MANDQAQVQTIAEKVLRKYAPKTLVDRAAKFDYPSGDLIIETGWDEFRRTGSMTRDDLVRLSLWKSGPRQAHNIEKNSAIGVPAITRAATRVADEVKDEPALAVGVLKTLAGVDIPTATTIMTVYNPTRFGIMDIRVWDVLRGVAPSVFPSMLSSAGHRRLFRLNEANLCLRVMREMAMRTGMTCRDVDKALWMIGRAGE